MTQVYHFAFKYALGITLGYSSGYVLKQPHMLLYITEVGSLLEIEKGNQQEGDSN